MLRFTLFAFLALLAASNSSDCADGLISREMLVESAQRAIAPIQKATAGSADQRECFTCHHQAVPIIALSAARSEGLLIDDADLERQIQHTITHLQRGFENYEKGKGQGGQVATAGYALLALDAAEWPADETTSAVVHYLLTYQRNRKHYSENSNRPPTSGSDFTATYLAVAGMQAFGTESQKNRIDKRSAVLAAWAAGAESKDTEDAVFRLKLAARLPLSEQLIANAATDLLTLQREDGGWAQLPDQKSDAYATATAVYALLSTGQARPDDDRMRAGLRFLLDAQRDDGTWHVPTRADGFQEYFESGFPYEEDQFISMSASSWALLAIVQSLSEADPPKVTDLQP